MEYLFSDFKEENGLVSCQNPHSAKNNYEKLHVHEASKLNVNYILFRRYYREQEALPFKSEPSVYVFEVEDSFFNTSDHVTLHAKLWSASQIQIYIIKGQSRVDIINARKPAKFDFKEKTLRLDDLVLASSAFKKIDDSKFSAYLFGTGTFWEQNEFRDKIDESDSPYIYLLDYLMLTRKKLLASYLTTNLKPETIDKLLITSILIKFIEQRDDDQGVHTLKDIYESLEVENFSDGIRKFSAIQIFDLLARQFSGKIFDNFSQDERDAIKRNDLKELVGFLEGDLDLNTGQYFLWKQYDFKYLPAEVISAIYENFIQAESIRTIGIREKGVVYTPIHLVNFLIDEVMPLDRPDMFIDETFKILDPTCGSGVFLVAAYKRLLQWWTINNSEKNSINYPSSTVAVKILENNIFGVDIKATATLVTVFGLTTALLDKLTPQEIWSNLKFSDLTKHNITAQSFFDWVLVAKNTDIQFDLVIGNPPFNVEEGKKKEAILTENLLANLNHKNIPDNNFALYFFEASMLIAKKACMIVPSSVLLYSKAAQSYRNRLFTNYTVRKIYDFTHLRESLFVKKKKKGLPEEKKTGRTPTVAIIVENCPSDRKVIEHIVIKRMLASEKKIGFEIDYYDKNYVKWEWSVDENRYFIWKTNLLGGGRLFNLIYKLSLHQSLKSFIAEKKATIGGWVYNNGYIGEFGNKNKNRQADFLNGKLQIKPKTFTEYGHFETEQISSEAYFWNIRTKELFCAPQIIFKLVVEKEKIPMIFSDKDLCFNSSFVGVSAPKSAASELYEMYNRLHLDSSTSSVYNAYILSTSPKALVYHETSIIKEDIDLLPYPNNRSDIEPSDIERILISDILKYYRHLGKALSNNSDGSIFELRATATQLESFGKVFCSVLNEIYSRDQKSWQPGFILEKSNYLVYQFGFGKAGELKMRSEELDVIPEFKALIENSFSNKSVIVNKVIRLYEHINEFDCVILIKPANNRYWLNSIAIRDADDTFWDLNLEGF